MAESAVWCYVENINVWFFFETLCQIAPDSDIDVVSQARSSFYHVEARKIPL